MAPCRADLLQDVTMEAALYKMTVDIKRYGHRLATVTGVAITDRNDPLRVKKQKALEPLVNAYCEAAPGARVTIRSFRPIKAKFIV